MKSRLSRTNAVRRTFKVDSLLERKLKESRKEDNVAAKPGFMTLTFLGYYDKRREFTLSHFAKRQRVECRRFSRRKGRRTRLLRALTG